MDKRFIIIHPSELLRKGLWSVLRENYHHEFILLTDIDGINDYSGISNLHIIVLLASEFNTPETRSYINRVLTACNEVTFISIYNEQKQLKAKEISIYQQGFEILNTVRQVVDDQKSGQVQLSELSDREKDVLGLVALGHSNKEIAEKLFISIHTVITHRKHITEKLGIKSISGLTVYAILNKLIDTENIDPSSLI